MGILCYCIFLLGWANTWEDIRRESKKIHSVSAQFSQKKHVQILTRPLVSKGFFYFQAPDSVRWEYTSPIKSVLITHKGNIKRYTQGEKGLVEDAGGPLEAMQIVLQEIGRWTRGEFTENEHFFATLKGGQAPEHNPHAERKRDGAMISRIVNNPLADRQGVIKTVKIFENEGNHTPY